MYYLGNSCLSLKHWCMTDRTNEVCMNCWSEDGCLGCRMGFGCVGSFLEDDVVSYMVGNDHCCNLSYFVVTRIVVVANKSCVSEDCGNKKKRRLDDILYNVLLFHECNELIEVVCVVIKLKTG